MLIGRKEELKTLHQALIADESKFVAIYGRRRVGKTFLVKETFNNDFAFYHTGLAKEAPFQKGQAVPDFFYFIFSYNYPFIYKTITFSCIRFAISDIYAYLCRC